MSAPIRRFDPYYKDDFGFRVMADMGESSTGDWVDYSDYAALEAQVRQLREALDMMLSSAHPNEHDHPAMFCAWKEARAVLAATEPKEKA